MRCECCPLSSVEDACSEWVDKRDSEYSNYLDDMGLDMGIEMSFSDTEFEQLVEICKHMIGLNYKKPYHRHGQVFYKPYRNYYYAEKEEESFLDRLSDCIIKKGKGDIFARYTLTSDGLKWLGRQLQITIKETRLE